MPTNEKEINNQLFDQLKIVETALELATKENATETVAYLENEKNGSKKTYIKTHRCCTNNSLYASPFLQYS